MLDRPDTILVPLDGSDLAQRAVAYAAMLANALDAQLLLFTAVGGQERTALEAFATGENLALDEAADAYLTRIAATAPGTDVELHHRISDNPATAIVDFAADHNISLIVMASHGRSGVSRWLLGSVADKVLQTSPVPVIVVPVRKHPTD